MNDEIDFQKESIKELRTDLDKYYKYILTCMACGKRYGSDNRLDKGKDKGYCPICSLKYHHKGSILSDNKPNMAMLRKLKERVHGRK